MRDYSGGYARTTVHQNSCCAGSVTSRCTRSGGGSASSELGDAGADEITDVVSCPGTDSCKLGITSSMGLNQAIQDRVVRWRSATS